MIRDPLLVLTFMLAIIAFARMLEERVAFVKTITSAVVCTLLGILFANIGLIGHTGPVHEAVNTYAIPYAIVLIIMGTDMRELKNAGWPMIIAYGAACLGSVIGGIIGGLSTAGLVGPETWKLSGAFAAAFMGGGLNFAAIGQSLDIDSNIFAAAAVADNMSTVPYMLLQIWLATALAGVFLRRIGSNKSIMSVDNQSQAINSGISEEEEAEAEAMRRRWTDTKINVLELAVLGALPLMFLWIAQQLVGYYPAIPEVIWLTTFALGVSLLPAVRNLNGAEVLSYFAMHIFFIQLGAASELSQVFAAGIPIISLMIIIMAVHVIVSYGVAWIFKIDLAIVTIASQAAVGGPGSALAISLAMKWGKLIAPGVIVGIFGYALGTYLGVLCANVVRVLLV
ncbi:MAG: DUF819 family protein [Longimicrobiales bacterium]|nr:DUF819 family protein [Longimicrobiales bacterium]